MGGLTELLGYGGSLVAPLLGNTTGGAVLPTDRAVTAKVLVFPATSSTVRVLPQENNAQ